ncbi:MAG: hypothetical protein QF464_23360, partial [Myxococcota bacterium]|nr:hypothetical protein [Myxococcota bacterium]
TFHKEDPLTATQFAAMGLAFAQRFEEGGKDKVLLSAADWLVEHQQPSGELVIDSNQAPISQGSMMTTANSIFALRAAAAQSGDERYGAAADRALEWLRGQYAGTTQDEVMQLLAMTREAPGDPLKKALMSRLLAEQDREGGWLEEAEREGATAFATGQVLYGLKRAGQPVSSPPFAAGVEFLMDKQLVGGQWTNRSDRPSHFAPTMWAVIGLAGSFEELVVEFAELREGMALRGPGDLRVVVVNGSGSPVEHVVFFLDDEKIGEGARGQEEDYWEYAWDSGSVPEGPHELKALVTTENGTTGEATLSILTESAPPPVSTPAQEGNP